MVSRTVPPSSAALRLIGPAGLTLPSASFWKLTEPSVPCSSESKLCSMPAAPVPSELTRPTTLEPVVCAGYSRCRVAWLNSPASGLPCSCSFSICLATAGGTALPSSA